LDTDGHARAPKETLIAQFTPQGDHRDTVTQLVVEWCKSTKRCSECVTLEGITDKPTWSQLLFIFCHSPNRNIMNMLWRNDGLWAAVIEAADYWDIPCLYWHMVYTLIERCDTIKRSIKANNTHPMK